MVVGTFKVCMILPGGGSRLQTWGGLASQLFDSALRTFDMRRVHHFMITSTAVARNGRSPLLGIGRVRVRGRVRGQLENKSSSSQIFPSSPQYWYCRTSKGEIKTWNNSVSWSPLYLLPDFILRVPSRGWDETLSFFSKSKLPCIVLFDLFLRVLCVWDWVMLCLYIRSTPLWVGTTIQSWQHRFPSAQRS